MARPKKYTISLTIVGHALIVVKRRRTLHAVFLPEHFCKPPEQKLRIFIPQTFRKSNDQLPPFNTLSRLLIALPEIVLHLFRQILLKLRLYCAVDCIQMFLSFRIADIVHTPPHIGQLFHPDEGKPWHVILSSRNCEPPEGLQRTKGLSGNTEF